MSLEQLNKVLSLTDGRDKLYKTLQGATKALAHFSAKDAAVPWGKVSSSIGEARSVMRLGKFATNIQKINGLLATAAQRGWDQFLVIELLRVLGDMGYVVGDNLAYVGKYNVVAVNPAACGKNAKIAQFWGFVCQVILDVFAILMLDPRSATYEAKRETALLNLSKDVADTLVVLAVVGYMPKSIYNPNGGIQGILLAFSGLISTYQNWNKATPEVKKQ